jgi:tetratricopeptide (TPR) repeat protein
LNLRPLSTRALAALLVLIAVIAYIPAIGAGYIWDDDTLLTANPQMRSLHGLAQVWLGDKSRDYTPLTLSAFWLQWHIWGANPVGYHIVSILLHALSAILIWRILIRLRIPGALLAALIFVIHPVNVASVAWIAELKNTLSGALFFASILAFLVSRDSHRRAPYLASVALFILAALSKGAVVTLPAVLLLCIFWRERKATSRDFAQLLPYALVAILTTFLTIKFQARAQHYNTILNGFGHYDLPWFRFVSAGDNIWYYIFSLIYPAGMSPMHPRSAPGTILPLLAAIALLILFSIYRRTWGRPLLFAWSWYLIMLLPVLGLVWMTFMQQASATDWWQYLAAPGIFACVAAAIATAARKWRLVHPIFATFLALLLVQTWLRADIYNSMFTYCYAVVAEDPTQWTLQNNLGILYKRQRRFADACECFQNAINFNPGYIQAYINYANTLAAADRPALGEKILRDTLKDHPGDPDILDTLSSLSAAQGNSADALTFQSQAAQADPTNPARIHTLARMLLAQGRFPQAEAAFRTAIALVPDSIPFHIELCQSLLAQGKKDAALQLSAHVDQLARQSANPNDLAAAASLRQLCATFPQ